jgi:hypothetical protein
MMTRSVIRSVSVTTARKIRKPPIRLVVLVQHLNHTEGRKTIPTHPEMSGKVSNPGGIKLKSLWRMSFVLTVDKRATMLTNANNRLV